MFTIPPLSGDTTFANPNDEYIKLRDSIKDRKSISQPTESRKWSSYILQQSCSVKKWMERLQFDLQHVALTESQILYFLRLAGTRLVPQEEAYFLTKTADELYLTKVSHSNVGWGVPLYEEKTEVYKLDYIALNDDRSFLPYYSFSETATLFFLY